VLEAATLQLVSGMSITANGGGGGGGKSNATNGGNGQPGSETTSSAALGGSGEPWAAREATGKRAALWRRPEALSADRGAQVGAAESAAFA
jgi:hypothetical protein